MLTFYAIILYKLNLVAALVFLILRCYDVAWLEYVSR